MKSTNGEYIATPHHDGMVRTWDTRTGWMIRRLKVRAGLCIQCVPIGRKITTDGSGGHQVRSKLSSVFVHSSPLSSFIQQEDAVYRPFT
jgi:hypothetical protein